MSTAADIANVLGMVTGAVTAYAGARRLKLTVDERRRLRRWAVELRLRLPRDYPDEAPSTSMLDTSVSRRRRARVRARYPFGIAVGRPSKARVLRMPGWTLWLMRAEDAERYEREWGAHLAQLVEEGALEQARRDRRRLALAAVTLAVALRVRQVLSRVR